MQAASATAAYPNVTATLRSGISQPTAYEDEAVDRSATPAAPRLSSRSMRSRR